MPYRLSIARGPTFAIAEVSALAFMEVAEDVLAEIATETRAHGDTRLLVNLLDVVGTFDLADQRQLGMLAVRHLSHLSRVASLVPEDKITHASEEAAVSEGLTLRVFTQLTAAVDWLLH
jgi:hypothetical protein